MRDLNRVILRGRIGNDPLVRVADNKSAWAKAALYTRSRWNGADGQPKEASERHTLVFRGAWAEMARDELRKGSLVQVEGYLSTREYEDPTTRLKQYATEVVVTDVVVIQASSRTRNRAPAAPAQTNAQGGETPF